MFKSVTAKLANMRKPQRFVVQRDQFGHYHVRSDKSCGDFDGKGRGILNTKGNTFAHLSLAMGVKAFTYPAEFLQECQELFYIPGEKLGVLGDSRVIYGGLTRIGGDANSLLEQYLTFQNHFHSHDKLDIKVGDMVWDNSQGQYIPYDREDLIIAVYRRRSPEAFKAFLATQIAKETISHDEQ